VFGAEQQNNMAAFNTILPFTRNAVSSMDFTPVVFSIRRNTTDAHEVATFLVFESGWTHAADNPESYRAHPEALRTLNMLPTVWDETRLLAGTPGREAYVARRNGGRWYVAGISGISAKTFTAPLNFLGAGQWMVDTLRDGSTATGSLMHETRVVTSTDTLSVPLLTNGGFVSVVCPFTAGMTGCAAPAATNLALNRPATADSSCNANEGPAKAVNGSISGGNTDKWCSAAAAPSWQVDLGSATAVRTVTVRHAGAGGESAASNTRDYDLQASTDGVNWTTMVQARANTASVTTHAVSVTARFVRLNVITPVQAGAGAARIYEVEVYA
jgi:hypothetical protein